MEPILTAAQMKAADAYTITEIGIPSLVLMERAALCVAEEMERAGMDLRRIAVFCGPGNNGGDGYALARLLREKGFSPVTFFVGNREKMTPETRLQKEIAEKIGVPAGSSFSPGEYTGIADALLGVGLHRPLKGELLDAVRVINGAGLPVAAVDIPTGVCADSGRILGDAVRADLTVTVAFKKLGQVLYPGAACCGRLVCRAIGISARGVEKERAEALEEDDLSLLPRRRDYSNKGTYGKVLICAGTKNVCGAAYFAAMAAAKCGSGMVKVLTRPCNREILQISLPQALLSTWDEEHLPDWENELAWADVVALGPGMGTDEAAQTVLLGALTYAEIPLVLDADALTILSRHGDWLEKCGAPVVITPHAGEMARLLHCPVADVVGDVVGTARTAAGEWGVTAVLKDTRTVVSDGKRVRINLSGNHGMACAGSGDVLTGVIASLIGQGMDAFSAASLGVYLHGRAGDLARQSCGAAAMGPADELEAIGRLLKERETI